MFTFVISLVVVGAALFFATRIAIGAAPEADKPATPVPRSVGGRHLAADVPDARESGGHESRGRGVPESGGDESGADESWAWGPTKDVERVRTLRRIRSGFLLLVMLTVLGAIAALVIVIFGALVLSALRSAVQ